MNKNTKIWLNSLIGLAVSIALLFGIWLQVKGQLAHLSPAYLSHAATPFLLIALLLMPLNLGIEVTKWRLLAGSAQPLSRSQAWKSYLAGIALSLITPNRIGEYPGRILYLKRKNTTRLISVSILGAFAQFITLFIYGIAGLACYSITNPGYWPRLLLGASLLIVILLCLLFFRFEWWSAKIEHISWLRRFQTYKELMKRFTAKEQLTVLGLSLLRFCIYTIQYELLLRWMNIPLPAVTGFFTACLYFWAIAVIPSIAFSELGVRGQVSLFLFQHYTTDPVGILVATFALWVMNVVLPAVSGSILLWRVRLLK